MKTNKIKVFLTAALVGLSLTSCEDFLDRPTEDGYVAGGYYKTDAECIAAVDYLYNSPWYDFQRGFFSFDVMAGNIYLSDGGDYTGFLRFGLTSNNQHIRNMSYSLWAVNGHSNVVRHYIEEGGASEAVKNQTMGECLLWKAMAYFYLVRTFGDVPIVHDNASMITAGTYNDQPKVQKADVYEYIIMTLEKAIELLPEQCAKGRLDKYCAKGLLAKVYLTKAGKMGLQVVYFPSCINQTMGLAKGAPVKNSVVDEMCQLLNKAGYTVKFPKHMDKMCCGQIWESKGMLDIADRKSAELEEALWIASEQGKYPILCDQSPCLHRMRKVMTKVKLYEPVEFIMTFLKDRLEFHPIDRKVAVHITCSTREMGLGDQLIALAKMCSNNVLVPEGVGCCGFAGDRGFSFPEVNKYALRKLKPQIEAFGVEYGYSNSRTCEIGLQTNSGVPYMSIAYLVNECTVPKK